MSIFFSRRCIGLLLLEDAQRARRESHYGPCDLVGLTCLILGPVLVGSLPVAVVWPGQRSELSSIPLAAIDSDDPSRGSRLPALLSLRLHLRPCPASIPAPCRIDLVEPESIPRLRKIHRHGERKLGLRQAGQLDP